MSCPQDDESAYDDDTVISTHMLPTLFRGFLSGNGSFGKNTHMALMEFEQEGVFTVFETMKEIEAIYFAYYPNINDLTLEEYVCYHYLERSEDPHTSQVELSKLIFSSLTHCKKSTMVQTFCEFLKMTPIKRRGPAVPTASSSEPTKNDNSAESTDKKTTGSMALPRRILTADAIYLYITSLSWFVGGERERALAGISKGLDRKKIWKYKRKDEDCLTCFAPKGAITKGFFKEVFDGRCTIPSMSLFTDSCKDWLDSHYESNSKNLTPHVDIHKFLDFIAHSWDMFRIARVCHVIGQGPLGLLLATHRIHIIDWVFIVESLDPTAATRVSKPVKFRLLQSLYRACPPVSLMDSVLQPNKRVMLAYHISQVLYREGLFCMTRDAAPILPTQRSSRNKAGGLGGGNKLPRIGPAASSSKPEKAPPVPLKLSTQTIGSAS
uniref:Uncharacterized protein n=1 Tax=Lotharella globosa TaxID=91324 RepID=A0A7S3YTN4_9EUKA